MSSAPQTPTSLHDDPAAEPVTATAKTTTTPKSGQKTTDAAPFAHQEALTTGTPRPAAAAAAARNNHERLPPRHILHRTLDSSFPGYDWTSIRHSRRIHLATRRQRKTWSPANAAAFPVFAYDPVRLPWQQPGGTSRRHSSPANWPANVILTAQMVCVLEHVKAACAERGDKEGKRWWEALCAARWPLNFTSTGKARAVQPVAPVGWPREGVREGDKVVDAEEEGVTVAVVGGGGDGEEGEGKGLGVEVVKSEAESTVHLGDALPEHVQDETSVTADDDGGGARNTSASGKRPAEDWRIDDAAHKRFLSDMQGSIMRLKKSYDEAKTESVQIPPHVRDKELQRLVDLEAEKSKDTARIQELEAEFEKEKARNQSHATKLETLLQAVQDVEAQSSDASEKLNTLDILFCSAFRHMIGLRIQLNGAKAQLEEATRTDTQKTNMLKDQQIEIEELEKRGKELLLQTEQYQENIKCLSRNGASSTTKIIELQRSLEEWQSRAQELQTQNENDRKILETLEQEASTQQSKISVLEETLKDHQSRAQMVQSQNEEEHAKLQESQMQVTELTARLEVAAKREKRLEESLGFVAQTMLDMIGKDANTAETVPGELTNGADVIAEQDGLKTLLEQLLAGQNGE